MINFSTKRYWIPVFFILLTSVSAADPGPDSISYDIQHYTSENGLPQNSVKSIAGDSSGFIWLTTESGLVRFDGRNFRIYNKSNTAISSNRMRYMFRQQATSDLYALTDDNRLLHINRQNVVPLNQYKDIFYNYPISPDSTLKAYRCIGLPDIFAEDRNPENYRIPVRSTASFVITPDTVRFFEKFEESWKKRFNYRDLWSFFTVTDQLYHLDNQGGFSLIKRDTLMEFSLTGDILDHPAYREKTIPKLYWNITSGDVFVYLRNSLYLLESEKSGVLKTRRVASGIDFDLKSIRSVYYDRKNRRLFLGSQTQGLYVISEKPFLTLRAEKVIAGDETYYSQISYDGNTVLTHNGNKLGLSGLSGVLPLVGRYSDRYSMLTDRQGNIWTKKPGFIYKLSPDGQRLMKAFTLPGHVTQLYEGRDSIIWIGTREAGLFRLDPTGNDKEPEQFADGVKEISYILQRTEDRLWLGTDSGLYRLGMQHGKLELIPGTESVYVRSLHIKEPHEIWFTTAENGVYLYKDGKLTNFPLDKNNYLSSSHCILEDAEGYFWITTNKGLFQAQKKDLLAYAEGKQKNVFYVYYGKEAGFNTNEFNGGCQPCGLILQNGYFSFPSLNGLVWFKPEEVKAELPYNDIYIDRIEIDSTLLPVTDTLRLHSDFNRMQIFFTTPYFGNPYNLSFRYQLSGPSGSNDWLAAESDNMISFSSLPSGIYHLTIRKQKGFNAAGYADKKLVIIIPPVFYETLWFKSLALFGLVLAVLYYIRFRLNNIKRKNDELERRIAERTLKLKETIFAEQASKDKLRQQNYMQQRLLAAITHDIKSPLQYLVMAAKALHENLPGRERNVEDDLERIYRSSSRVFHFTENLVRYMKVNMAGTKLNNEPVNLRKLIEEKIEIFSEMSESKGNAIYNDVDGAISLRTNEQLLGIVIHNLLDNAVKFTRSGNIRFSSTQTEDQLMIILEDTGKGMPGEMIDWCNNFGFRNKASETDLTPKGLGLTIVIELLDMIDGKLFMAKREQGTRVEVTL